MGSARVLWFGLALTACKGGDGGKPARADGMYHPLATCGITYADAAGWVAVDPAPILDGAWLPRIEALENSKSASFREARARFERGEARIEVTCSAHWNAATRLTLDGTAVSKETFPEFVDETRRGLAAHSLAAFHESPEVQLAGGAALKMTIVTLRPGLVEEDQRRDVWGFGGLDAGDKHVMIGFTGPEDEVDLDQVRAFLGGVRLP